MIDAKGEVTDATVDQPDATFATCLAAALRTLRFDKSTGVSRVEITFTALPDRL